MKDLIKEYFIFQKSDRNGILLLSALLAILTLSPHMLTYIYIPQKTHSDDFKNQVATVLPYLEEGRQKQFPNETKFNDKTKTTQNGSSYKKKKTTWPTPFNFDPNKLTIDESIRLGFSEKQAKVIEKYIRNGGRFYKKEDFKKSYVVSNEIYDHLKDHIQISSKKEFTHKTNNYSKKETSNYPKKKKYKNKQDYAETNRWNLKPFDPNLLDKTAALNLGFPKKMAQTIENYLAKGGSFKHADDVAKIYGMTPEIMDTIKPFINIFQKTIEKENPKIASAPICINKADPSELLLIPGIGPFFSKAIVEHRKKLGGYISKEQLMEIFKMDQEKYDAISQYITIDKQTTQRINLNTADYESLRNHPYIEHSIAKGLINYRKQHGDFTNISDIRQSYLIDEVLYKKLAPYLTVK